MKKFLLMFVVVFIVSLSSCSGINDVINAGTPKPNTSDVHNDAPVASIPAVNEENIYSLGEKVDEPFNEESNDYKFSYSFKEIKAYSSLSEIGLDENDLILFEGFLNEKNEVKDEYKLLVLDFDVLCKYKQENVDHNAFCPSVSVGTLTDNLTFKTITNEPNYFAYNNITNNNAKDYYQFVINENETKTLKIGWFVDNKLDTNQLYAKIGSSAIGSDGDYYTNEVYVNLGD